MSRGGGYGYDDRRPPPGRVYVANLPSDVRESEVDDLFYKFGRIKDISIKGGRGGPCYAFIEYEDNRDADDAIRRRDGYEFAGGRLRVEATRGGGPPRGPGGGAGYTGKRGDHVAIVTGVPQGGSWQDLKDFCRNGGIPNVLFADVNGSEGMVEFANADDLKKAVRDLDDTKFRTHRDESGFVRVKAKNGGGGSRSRSRSRGRDSRSRSRGRDSRSRSPARKESKSRSRSPARKGSRSRSRSRSP